MNKARYADRLKAGLLEYFMRLPEAFLERVENPYRGEGTFYNSEIVYASDALNIKRTIRLAGIVC